MKKQIFFIARNDVYDIYGDGGAKATQRNYELCKKNSMDGFYSCTLLPYAPSKELENDLFFRRPANNFETFIAALFGFRNYFPWQEKKILKVIQEKRPEVLFLDSSIIGRLLRKRISCKTIVFFHNVEVDYAWNQVKNEGIWHLPGVWLSKINEKCAVKKADKIACLNERDAFRIKELYGRKVDFYLPISFIDRFEVEKTSTEYKKEIMFLGSFFGPNQTAVEWFIENVMTKIKDVTFNIIGKNFECKKDDYEKYSNVNVIGSVEEPDSYYYRHAVVVMPIQYGAGMKVKTAEAMMFGRIILASDEALEGYDVKGVEGIYFCNRADEYVAKINDIFSKESLPAYQRAVRKCFMEKYETRQLEQKFADVLNSL